MSFQGDYCSYGDQIRKLSKISAKFQMISLILVGQPGVKNWFHFGAWFATSCILTSEMLSSKISASGKIALLLNYNSPSVITELSLLTVYFSRHRSELEFFSVAVCCQNLTDLCVSVRFNTAEAINECDLKLAKKKA